MEYDPKDNEVVHLLKKLKQANGTYPPEMLALRRKSYMHQVGQISAGAGLAMGLKNLAKGGKGTAGLPPAAGTIVEALLVVAIAAEAGVAAYFYRDKLVQVFHSVTNSPKVEEVASPPVLPSPLVEIEFTPSPVFTVSAAVSETGTITLTSEGTPSPELAAEATKQNTGSDTSSVGTGNTTSGTGGSGTGVQSGSSPDSNSNPKSNNGNHYGQTPQPERTKEQGNDASSNNAQDSSSNQSNSNNKNNKP